jgi:hypothetical protein
LRKRAHQKIAVLKQRFFRTKYFSARAAGAKIKLYEKLVEAVFWGRFHEPEKRQPQLLFVSGIAAKTRPAASSFSTKRRQGLPKKK